LERVAFFGGGATLEAIERVCGVNLPGKLFDILSALVDKNLIFTREGQDRELRFWMLETIHEYSAGLLRMNGEYEILQQRLIEYFADLAEQYEQEIHSPQHVHWNARMLAERNNLTPIFNWLLPDPWEIARLRIIAGLAEHWFMNGSREDMHWVPTAIQKAADAPIDLRARVLRTVGEIYRYLGRQSQAEKLLRDSIELFEQTGDERNAAWAMTYLSAVIDNQFPENFHLAQRSLEIFRQYGDEAGISKSLTSLGELARIQGDLATAETCYKESLMYSLQIGERFRDSVQYSNLSFICFRRGAYQQALEYSLRGLRILLEMDIPDVSTLLYSLAGPTVALGNPQKAACLSGAAQAQLDSANMELQTADLQDAQSIIAAIRQALDEVTWLRAWQAGYIMTPQQAIEFALQGH
jgi:tetratricopeptide (TPR) repeat protein